MISVELILDKSYIGTTDFGHYVYDEQKLPMFIREYAKAVATQALIDASNSVNEIYKDSGLTNTAVKVKESILNTPIQLP